jgi:hypothetical protein
MSKLRGTGPREDRDPSPAQDADQHPEPHVEPDPELTEFASRPPLPRLAAEFRDELRSELWQLLRALLARFPR